MKRFFPFGRAAAVIACALMLASVYCAAQADKQNIAYTVTFYSGKDEATVRVLVPHSQWLKALTFNLEGRRLHSPHTEHGTLTEKKDSLIWQLPDRGTEAVLEYQVSINEKRDGGLYSAYVCKDWVIMRADDLVPPFKARFTKGSEAEATVEFVLPDQWSSVNIGYERDEGNRFFVRSDRKVPRPTGWIIAGNGLSTRHDVLGTNAISVSGPPGQDIKPMETLAFLGMVWPQIEQVFPNAAYKILIVSAGDPMWRGGLSASNSLYVHTDRPLVSENGTSTLVHELMHVLLGIRDAKNHDWITEGLAEYYSIELLSRAGAYTPARKQEIYEGLKAWSKNVDTLLTSHSQAETTARAALLFAALDQEIQQKTDGKENMDALVAALLDRKNVSLNMLAKEFEALTGKQSRVLATPLLKAP